MIAKQSKELRRCVLLSILRQHWRCYFAEHTRIDSHQCFNVSEQLRTDTILRRLLAVLHVDIIVAISRRLCHAVATCVPLSKLQ